MSEHHETPKRPDITLVPRTYQPLKAEFEDEFEMPG